MHLGVVSLKGHAEIGQTANETGVMAVGAARKCLGIL